MARPLKAEDLVPPALPTSWVGLEPSAPGAASRVRLAKTVFFIVFAFTVVSITRPVDSNVNIWARMSLTFSVVERGSVNIDPYMSLAPSIDWSYANGHYYSNKAPGPSLLAVPVYAGQRFVQRMLGLPDGTMASYRFATWLANIFVGVLPTVVALLLLWKLFERRYGFTPRGAFGMTALAGVASLSFPYTTLFFGHQTAVAFLTIGVALTLLEATEHERPRSTRIFLAGLCFGLAVFADHLAGIAVLIWSAWLLYTWRKHRSAWLWWALGGAGPALALLAYNNAAFGSPFTGSYSISVLNPVFKEAVEWHRPSLLKFLQLTIGPSRGWFFATPVFVCVIGGMVLAWKHRREWPELLFAIPIVGASLLLLASWNSWHGGEAVGPRYLLWTLPFAMLLLVPVARRIPHPMIVLGQLSALFMLVITITDPLLRMDWTIDPFSGSALPILRGVQTTHTTNVWSLFSAPPLVALLLYLALWFVAGRWIDRQLRETESSLGVRT